MPFLVYGPERKISQGSLDLINQANAICREYEAQNLDLTLRQLYYQFVARDLLQNTFKNYKRLGEVLSSARMEGRMDWKHLKDRGRDIDHRNQFGSATDFIKRATRAWFHTDWWEDQPVHVEVWVEKDALSGVIESATYPMDVTSLACKGYLSTSEAWEAGQRLLRFVKAGKRIVILHLGDHDPSGIQMSEDNENRLQTFLHYDLVRALAPFHPGMSTAWSNVQKLASVQYGIELDEVGHLFEFRRIALNMDQVEQYAPPPNFAKQTDSRFAAYEELYGDESWELDALDPNVLIALVNDALEEIVDEDLFDAAQDKENTYRERITHLIDKHGDMLLADYDPETEEEDDDPDTNA